MHARLQTAALAATYTPSRGGTTLPSASQSSAQHGLRPPLPSPSPRRGVDTVLPQSPGTCSTPRLTCPRKPNQQADLAHTPNYAGTKLWQPLKQDKPGRSGSSGITSAVDDAAALQGLVAAGAAAAITPGTRAGYAGYQEQVAAPALSGTQRHRAQQSASSIPPVAPAWTTGSIAAPGSPDRRYASGLAYSSEATAVAAGPWAPASYASQRHQSSMSPAARQPSSSPVHTLSPALQRSQHNWSPLSVPSPRAFQPTAQSSPSPLRPPGLRGAGSPRSAAGPEPATPLAYNDILPNRVASVLPKAERHGAHDTSTARDAFFAKLTRTRPPTPPAPSSVSASPQAPAAQLSAAASVARPGTTLSPAQHSQAAAPPSASTSTARPASTQETSATGTASSSSLASSQLSSPEHSTVQSQSHDATVASITAATTTTSTSRAAGSSAGAAIDHVPRKPGPLDFRDVVHAVSASTGTGDGVSWDLSRQLLALRTANAMITQRGPAEGRHIAHAHPALSDLGSRIPPSMQHVAHVAATAASLAARGPAKPARTELQPMPLQSDLDTAMAGEPQRAGLACEPPADAQPAPAPAPAPAATTESHAHGSAAAARPVDVKSTCTSDSDERKTAPPQAQRAGNASSATARSGGSTPPLQPARKSPGRFVSPQDMVFPASPARAETSEILRTGAAEMQPPAHPARPHTLPPGGATLLQQQQQQFAGAPSLPDATKPKPAPAAEQSASMPAELAAALAAARAADATEAAAAAEFARSLRSQLAQLRVNLQALQDPASPLRASDTTPVARVRLQDEW